MRGQNFAGDSSELLEHRARAASHHVVRYLHRTEQADAEQRLKQYGPNTIKAQQKTTAVGLLLSQFKSPLYLILSSPQLSPVL